MTIYKNSYLFTLLILFLFSNFVSCSGTGQRYLYKEAVLKTDAITLPDCQPAKGLTRVKITIWLHPELFKGQNFLFESITLIDWETSKVDEMINLRIKITGDLKLNKKLTQDIKIADFTCNIRKNGLIDNIIHTKRETTAEQKAHYLMKQSDEEYAKMVSFIIPQFQVHNFKSGDTVAVGIEDLSEYIKGMDNFPIKSVYRGISTYNGKTVIVIENNDKVVKGRLTAYQTGYALYDNNTRYMVASEGEVKVNLDQTNVFRATTKISTDMQQQ